MNQNKTDKTTFRQFNLKLRIFAALFGISIPSNVEYSETDKPIPDKLTADKNIPTLAEVLSGADGTKGKWLARALVVFIALALIISVLGVIMIYL